ncbi:type I DNA topoisomerase [Acidiferrobacter thiooxydans]|uniref:DNA topoisomerase 1 n=1 Tax=Acidiferrobacter thiooxydans TaxID=163359 RepID=A0A1C2G3X9_9GAMM|nr:type I DNA topoisomerase [Acidiferrobacter thiooxydans]MDA8119963.1 type I DNA topoisomerase [Gammaproteobacteria bacterium]MDA8191689.1 type I DNA topoisomerase [Gammaproteobacteria bacterium]RCN58354.1 type I DNA topoisomerase [Acidiferrobacter thiooxydans]UEN99951.1 type I DNA topoisomerase [Acidiferrobacter thiooxydans]
MTKNLIIVESPAKAKTMGKYLGKGFTALASYGHVRDLIPKKGAVDTDHDFSMKYEVIEKNRKHIDVIIKAMKKADVLYLATDPDREGEAISWHLYEILKDEGLLGDKPVHRVVFHEITKGAIQKAVAEPRALSENLVNAQQARRALDYLVGFNLSPLLWKKVRRGLSAGRVQSPALRLIVEREEEIERFVEREYWTIDSEMEASGQAFRARLMMLSGERLDQFAVTDATRAAEVEARLKDGARDGHYRVRAVERKQRRRNPAPPFTTSTLQQEAARKLYFTAQRTMRTAQQLYEGVAIEGETVGLITYMRTDSVTLAQDALTEIRGVIAERFGADKLPSAPHVYKTRSKNAQEAHEAIRPTSVGRAPEDLRPFLTPEQLKLYDLIWRRTMACQMIPAVLDTMAVDLEAGPGDISRATGSVVLVPGFMTVYQEDADDKKGEEDESDRLLPDMREGERIALKEIHKEQHFTEPPPRYSEASLVKTLEAFGIGRPSTYATIIQTLQQREYVVLDKRRFKPTDVGRVVNKFLAQHFERYVDYDFTARLEDDLDAVSRGEKEWVPLLRNFWSEFHRQVSDKEDAERPGVEVLAETCPQCHKPLSKRLGRNGYFIGCTGYPECDYTRNLGEEAEAPAAEVIPDRVCPLCASPLVIKRGRYGRFIGCSNYPSCRHMEPLEKPSDTGVTCPECRQGTLLKRKSRYGKIFYSCSRYPDCKYAVWNPPLAEPCPQCGHPILTIKTTKRRGTEKVCPQKECGYSIPCPECAEGGP